VNATMMNSVTALSLVAKLAVGWVLVVAIGVSALAFPAPGQHTFLVLHVGGGDYVSLEGWRLVAFGAFVALVPPLLAWGTVTLLRRRRTAP
jgi:hypothetical protein